MVHVDLNADLGELPGPAGARSDAAVLAVVTTAHVACGAHAGDADTMRRTVAAAAAAGVVVGAHPSYPDRPGFGRVELGRSPARIRDDVLDQVAALREVADLEGAPVRSVKAHGALYNRMAVDEDCAAAVAGAVAALGGDLVLVVLAGSRGLDVARGLGLRVAAEGFCDRGYLDDGTLAPRGTLGALVEDPEAVGQRAASIVRDGRLASVGGSTVPVACETLCVHGDVAGAPSVARAVRRAIERCGVAVEPFVGPLRR
jgi:5-oxoprolinase (ATP-hydrolysing) subunit A